MTGKRIVDVPPHRRPTASPPVHISDDVSFEAKRWPHPGPNDNGPILRLFAEMWASFPDELTTPEGVLVPTKQQLRQAIDDSGTDLQVAIEQYLTGLEPGRKWTDRKMERLYQRFMDRSLSVDELRDVVVYAIAEHGVS